MRPYLLLAILFVLPGCASRRAYVAPPPPQSYTVIGASQGTTCGLLLFGVIPIAMDDRPRLAYQEAIEEARATARIDTTVSTHWWWTPVGSIHCYDIAGTAIR
jgi:hypothetical protein